MNQSSDSGMEKDTNVDNHSVTEEVPESRPWTERVELPLFEL